MTLAEWQLSARRGWRNPLIRWVTVATLVCIVGMSSFVAWKLLPVGLRSGVVILHYNIYLGIDQVQSWQWMFLSPAIMFGILIVNALFALGCFANHELAAKACVMMTAILTVLWGVSSFFLVLVNV